MGSISGSGIDCAAPIAASATSRATMRALRVGAAAMLAVTLSGATSVTSLEVEVAGLRSTKGVLRLCLTADPGNFPDCKGDGRTMTRTVPATERMVRFEGVPPGTWAVAIIHDENGNKKLDTFIGIPREGFGFSRNPAIGFGPPRFKSAGFAIAGDALTQQVRIRYLL